jgi:hypothetical protein
VAKRNCVPSVSSADSQRLSHSRGTAGLSLEQCHSGCLWAARLQSGSQPSMHAGAAAKAGPVPLTSTRIGACRCSNWSGTSRWRGSVGGVALRSHGASTPLLDTACRARALQPTGSGTDKLDCGRIIHKREAVSNAASTRRRAAALPCTGIVCTVLPSLYLSHHPVLTQGTCSDNEAVDQALNAISWPTPPRSDSSQAQRRGPVDDFSSEEGDREGMEDGGR